MPSHRQRPTVDDVRRFVAEQFFPPSGAQRVGPEVEWLTVPTDGSHSNFELVHARASAAPRPGASALSFEPGGQVELSSIPCDIVEETCARVAADTQAIVDALLPEGIRLAGIGLDPIRHDRRVLHKPRYDAMEAFFALDSPSGRTMMCSTVAIQVNLDAGATTQEIAWRWRLAHRIGPVLAAAF